MPEPSRKSRGRSIETISTRRRMKLERVIRRRQTDLALVLENVWDPHNVSACLRTADAVGIQDVHLLYHVEQAPNMKRLGKQSSASAKKWLTFHHHDDVASCFAELRAQGFTVCVSHLTRDAVPLYDLNLTGKVALVFGNEHRGVSAEAAESADALFFIPMMGMVQSLNISVATAVTLYEACRQRIVSGQYEGDQITPDALTTILEEWARM